MVGTHEPSFADAIRVASLLKMPLDDLEQAWEQLGLANWARHAHPPQVRRAPAWPQEAAVHAAVLEAELQADVFREAGSEPPRALGVAPTAPMAPSVETLDGEGVGRPHRSVACGGAGVPPCTSSASVSASVSSASALRPP